MARSSGHESPISYRPPEDLRKEFHARVEHSGLSASGYITQCVFGAAGPRAARRPPLERQDIAHVLAELARLCDRLQARSCDNSADAALFAEAVRDLREIRAACLSALGRKP